ncbi:MAG: hypothetical protein GYA55_10625 [SAR324 cluster bacterium]|uniref:Uncharacterized protein n=1 Tax=SAR324 cluster bacterium TaxID=2024889 RepID=A0A7X9FSQ2_9DELT|nr:hypothetical protein [SAR324 cluster bacterium]
MGVVTSPSKDALISPKPMVSGGRVVPKRIPYNEEDFQVIKYSTSPYSGWNEVAAVERGLKSIVKYIKEAGISLVVLPGMGAKPLHKAIQILCPDIPSLHCPALSKLGKKSQSEIDQIIGQDIRLQQIAEEHKNGILFLDDAVCVGRTLFEIKTAMKRVFDIDVHTGALFVVGDGSSIQEGKYPDIKGTNIVHDHAPTWYFMHRDPELHGVEGDEALDIAVKEIAIIANNIAADLGIAIRPPCLY